MSNVSVILLKKNELPYSIDKFYQTIETIKNQTYSDIEIIVVESGEPELKGDFKHLYKNYSNRAEMINHAIKQSNSKYILLLLTDEVHIKLKNSAVECFLQALERDGATGLVYSDYDLIDSKNNINEIHLLDYHNGRLRDNIDFGKALFYRKLYIEEIGYLDESLKFGELYDLRLKLSENYKLKLISNKYNGSLYNIELYSDFQNISNVFDYLLADKEYQIEMEKILTEHLKRTNTYLPPDFNYHKISYTKKETENFKYIASIIIPVNNRPEFIEMSLKSALYQTVSNIEIIVVVNGGNNDPTIDIVKDYMENGKKYNPDLPPVKLIVHDINNIGFCLNTGLKASQSKYYIQLDSDDRLKEDAVIKIVKEFEKDPYVGMVIGSYEVWEKLDNGDIIRNENIPVVTHDEWTYENGRNNLLRINGAGAPRAFHIKVIKEMGWFSLNDEPYSRNYGEDYDMVLKISEKYKIARIWEPIYEVIRHKGGTDHSIDRETIERNNNAKDYMRLEALNRRKKLM